MSSSSKRILFVSILLFTIFLNFHNISTNDINGDHALFSVRALGWFDFLGGGQRTPIQWFGRTPWWSHLSFHDHPPLVFLLQHLSFRLFGDTPFAARLPFALAGVTLVCIVYIFVKKLYSENVALLAALFFAVSSYMLWVIRSGYLEGIEILFITLAVLMFGLYIKTEQKKYLWFWAIFTGLALLSKYTALFLLPAAVMYFWIWRRETLQSKDFWFSLLLIVILLSPVIIYNAMVFVTRGHFDLALSLMFGMHPKDYEIVSGGGYSKNIVKNIFSFFSTLAENMSITMFILLVSIWLVLSVETLRKKGDRFISFLVINTLGIFLLFAPTGSSSRHLGIVMPFIILISVYGLFLMYKRHRFTVIAMVTGVVIFELFYSFNTNIVPRPVFKNRFAYSANRFYNKGFLKLEQYLKDEVFITEPPLMSPGDDIYRNLLFFETIDKELVIVDERLNWFSRVWHLQRHHWYYQKAVMTFTDVARIAERMGAKKASLFDFLKGSGARHYYLVLAKESAVVANLSDSSYTDLMSQAYRYMEEHHVLPAKIIYDDLGDETMYVYRVRHR